MAKSPKDSSLSGTDDDCPYPDCKGKRAHGSPHLIEAAAIEKRIDKAIAARFALLQQFMNAAYMADLERVEVALRSRGDIDYPDYIRNARIALASILPKLSEK